MNISRAFIANIQILFIPSHISYLLTTLSFSFTDVLRFVNNESICSSIRFRIYRKLKYNIILIIIRVNTDLTFVLLQLISKNNLIRN